MRSEFFALSLALLALSFPASAQVVSNPPISPAEAIQRAAEVAPDNGIQGTFLVTVKASGEDKHRGEIFLNSELDYRDQRNLTIRLEPSAVAELKAKYGKDLKSYFIGKQLLVSGTARRVTIYFGTPRFSAMGKLRSKYYFQTHVPVASADQIAISAQTP